MKDCKGKVPVPDFLQTNIIYTVNVLIPKNFKFIAILNEKHIAEMFKVGKIISLYKGEKKDKCDLTNCRDITLTFVVSKLLEKIILSRIENEYFTQCGFSRDHDAMPAC